MNSELTSDLISGCDVLIVGAGLSGCVIAERFATELNKKVLVIDKRNHIAGNCYDFIDENNILMNQYGAHLFHTNSETVWEYINRFGKWQRWEHKVVGMVDGQLVPIPVNITTVNMLCGTHLQTESEMNKWLDENVKSKYADIPIENSEDVAKTRVGDVLYEKIFKHYTWKQWNKYPAELAPEVLQRIPIRNNFDDRYFSDKYQVLPEKGYTEFCKKILDHPNISVFTGVDFFKLKQEYADQFKQKIIIYTGPIDTYFKNSELPPLEYRSIDFQVERIKNIGTNGYFQPNSVVNYPEIQPEFTRIVEYKHFLNQKSEHTTIVREYTTDVGEPYYPVPNSKNQEVYEQYKKLAIEETQKNNVHFLGRLANYKYFNMDQAIDNSLTYFYSIFKYNPLKHNVKVVVSRYNENIDWTKKLNNVVIFNKGEALADKSIINLPNVGREGHTFYKYIYDNYDNLCDYTMFLQGHPFDHSPNLFKNIDSILNQESLPDFVYLSETIVYTNLKGCPYHYGKNFTDIFKKIFGKNAECNKNIKFGAGAQFIVSKKAIHSKPRLFYNNIVNLLSHCTHPDEGYALERFHHYIFNTSEYK